MAVGAILVLFIFYYQGLSFSSIIIDGPDELIPESVATSPLAKTDEKKGREGPETKKDEEDEEDDEKVPPLQANPISIGNTPSKTTDNGTSKPTTGKNGTITPSTSTTQTPSTWSPTSITSTTPSPSSKPTSSPSTPTSSSSSSSSKSPLISQVKFVKWEDPKEDSLVPGSSTAKYPPPSFDTTKRALVNPKQFFERPDENMFVDLSLVTLNCDTLMTRPQQCMDWIRTHESEYLVRRQENLPKCDPAHPMVFHAYWRGLFGRGLIFILKSFLFTQRLDCARYILWTEGFVPLDVDQVALIVDKERLELAKQEGGGSNNGNGGGGNGKGGGNAGQTTDSNGRKFPKTKSWMHYESLLALKKMAPFIEVKSFNLSEELFKGSGISRDDWDFFVDSELLNNAERAAQSKEASDVERTNLAKLKSKWRWPEGRKVKAVPRFKWPVNMLLPKAELSGSAVSDSDTVRFVLLYNYGGMYVDTDVVFLKDMRPWYYTPKTWSSAWSIYDSYNTALLKATLPGDPVIALIMDKGIANGAKFHPQELLKYLKMASHASKNPHLVSLAADSLMTLVPTDVFDPTWPWFDGWREKPYLPNININSGLFFGASQREIEFAVLKESLGLEFIKTAPIRQLRTLENLFAGSPALHCHGIGYEIEKDSWVDILLDHYDCFLAGTCKNIYNEEAVR